MADSKPNLVSWYCNTCLVIFHEDPITWCLVSQNYDNVNVYSSFLPCQQIMCRISNYRSKRVIYFWPISVNYHWAIFAPIISRHYSRWIISKRLLRRSCAVIQPFSRTTESRHDVRPARCRGQLPRVMYFRPAVAKNTFVYCLFARRSGSPIALEFGQLFNRLWFLRAAQFLMFPFVLGKFIYRPTFDCLCERYLTMIPCMLYAGDFRLMSYCVDWLFTSSELLSELTVHKLIVHEYSRFSSCSTEHLWIVSPQPRTPTRRRQSIDVYDLPQSTKEVHGLYAIASVNVFYAAPVVCMCT